MKKPFPEFQVDLTAYANVRRRVGQIYPRAVGEMLYLVINFHYESELIISHNRSFTKARYVGKPVSLAKLLRAMRILEGDGFIKCVQPSSREHAAVYRRTEKFEQTFHFRKMPKRIYVLRHVLTREGLDSEETKHGVDIASIPQLRVYSNLVSKVKLSLANGNQVFEDVVLQRKKGARLYQLGMHEYQTLPSAERGLLLIDRKRTTELDYANLHPVMLHNRLGREFHVKPGKGDMYSRLLKELGIRKTRERRGAIKDCVLIALNIGTLHGFCSYLGRERKAYREHLKGLVKPREIYSAIIRLYPLLKPYVCTSKQHGFELQRLDSDIMIDVLETLARKGIIALPEHDSVIVLTPHKQTVREVMKQAYKQHMGFEIEVK